MVADDVFKLDLSKLNLMERISLIHKIPTDERILEYLKNNLKNLWIKNLDTDSEGCIMDLMEKYLLEGACWQTTESAVLFLQDTDWIQRGYLTYYKKYDFPVTSNKAQYHHSWVCFQVNDDDLKDKTFVFDPCLKIIVEEKIYDYVFQTEKEGFVKADAVKAELISKLGKNEVEISGGNDPYSPMYRNHAVYRAEIYEGKIMKIIVKFYKEG
jgi:hypothetical protein